MKISKILIVVGISLILFIVATWFYLYKTDNVACASLVVHLVNSKTREIGNFPKDCNPSGWVELNDGDLIFVQGKVIDPPTWTDPSVNSVWVGFKGKGNSDWGEEVAEIVYKQESCSNIFAKQVKVGNEINVYATYKNEGVSKKFSICDSKESYVELNGKKYFSDFKK